MQIYKNIPDTLVESWFKDIGWEKSRESPPITGAHRCHKAGRLPMGACGPHSVPSGLLEAVWSPPNAFVLGSPTKPSDHRDPARASSRAAAISASGISPVSAPLER